MPARRILSLWFPCLAAERLLRGDGAVAGRPFATVGEARGAQILSSLSPEALAAGLSPGQPLRDALAMCPALLTRPADPLREGAFLATLRRWAGQFTPWVAEQPPEGLMLDITGCAHLFGGEAGMLADVAGRAVGLRLTVRMGLADTPGAAWALARYGQGGKGSAGGLGSSDSRSGDDIAAEAHATRARAARRTRRTRAGETLLPPLTPPEEEGGGHVKGVGKAGVKAESKGWDTARDTGKGTGRSAAGGKPGTPDTRPRTMRQDPPPPPGPAGTPPTPRQPGVPRHMSGDTIHPSLPQPGTPGRHGSSTAAQHQPPSLQVPTTSRRAGTPPEPLQTGTPPPPRSGAAERHGDGTNLRRLPPSPTNPTTSPLAGVPLTHRSPGAPPRPSEDAAQDPPPRPDAAEHHGDGFGARRLPPPPPALPPSGDMAQGRPPRATPGGRHGGGSELRRLPSPAPEPQPQPSTTSGPGVGGVSMRLPLTPPPDMPPHPPPNAAVAAPGQVRAALDRLPVAALRVAPEVAEALARLGLRRIGDIAGMPRAALARRFGQDLLRRLDQALGLVPEPVSPARPADRFAVRLSLPDPIGLIADMEAGVDRLLPRLAARLAAAGRGVRRLRLEALRVDGRVLAIEVGLARPSAEPDRMRPLLRERLDRIDAGFGIDALRLEAVATEPVHAEQHRGHLDAAAANSARQTGGPAGLVSARSGHDGPVPAGRSGPASGSHAGPASPAAAPIRPGLPSPARLDDLIGRLGARLGIEAVTRLHPADSHIPEKAELVFPAAFCAPAPGPWPALPVPRPILIHMPEPVQAPDAPAPPMAFRWRRQTLHCAAATGPERIAPEWWLDDPGWRSGVRDYWRVETTDGRQLWLFYAHGGEVSGGWFCQGLFA